MKGARQKSVLSYTHYIFVILNEVKDLETISLDPSASFRMTYSCGKSAIRLPPRNVWRPIDWFTDSVPQSKRTQFFPLTSFTLWAVCHLLMVLCSCSTRQLAGCIAIDKCLGYKYTTPKGGASACIHIKVCLPCRYPCTIAYQNQFI